jgi:DMSO reductase family type II enzyme heme b subunit
VLARYAAGIGIAKLLDPHASAWTEQRRERLALTGTPLGLQPTDAIRTGWSDKKIGAIAALEVAALHDGQHLALRLEWADATESRAIDDNDRFVDGAAVAFPVSAGAPLVTMGAPGQPVNAWYWRADSDAGRHVIAEGLGTSRTLDQEQVKARGSWRSGRWHVVIARALQAKGASPVVQLEPGMSTGFGVAVWEGGAGERAGLKAVSGFEWHSLELEALPVAGSAARRSRGSRA